MTRNIALALTIAAISTSAAAQSSRKQPTWDDLLKPVEAKTNPNVPIAPIAPPTVEPAVAAPEITTTLKDACIVNALSRLPNIDGMRVTHSSYEFYKAEKHAKIGQVIAGQVFVSVEVRGHQAHYQWMCSVAQDSGHIALVAGR